MARSSNRIRNGRINGPRIIPRCSAPFRAKSSVWSGVLLLSRDGIEIEASVRAIRLTVLAVFAGALVVTILLSLYLARTIAQPVLRLAAAAERVRRGYGPETQQIPDFTNRGDEIGELSGVLREMTDALPPMSAMKSRIP